MIQTRCLSQESLRLLLEGNIPSPQAEEFEAHLLNCPECTAAARQACIDDELTCAVRNQQIIKGGEELLDQAIEFAKQLGSQAETIRSKETQLGERRAEGDEYPANQRPVEAVDIAFLAPSEQPDEIGRLGGYRVLEVLGVGGMGIVFRGEDPKLKRKVALKAMKPAIAASRSARERFRKEAEATASIEHDHIVTIYQVGEDRGVPFIAMPLLQGESLQKRLDRENRFDQTEAVRLGRQIASGLNAAHQCGLVHRDIKPDNIWLDSKQGRVKIVDFGLVRLTGEDTNLTQTGMVVGTPKYMAPEQAQGHVVDHRCDLFSLGSVLYHMLTGRPPFGGASVTATLIAVAQTIPIAVETLCPNLDADLVRLITRLLSKDPDQRPQSAEEVVRLLSDIERRVSTPIAETRSAALSVTQTIELNAGVFRQPKRSPRRTILALGALAVLLLAGLITIVTKKGTVTINIPDKMAERVKVTIRSDQEEVAVLDNGNQWTVKLSGGRYTVDLQGGHDEFRLKENQLTVSRFGTSIVELEYTPARASNSSKRSTAAPWRGWPAEAPPPATAPFVADEAKQHQEAWATHHGVQVEFVNGIGMKFHLIPPGEFTMGGSQDEIAASLALTGANRQWQRCVHSEAPRHKVILTQPFYMGVHEVTQQDYETVRGANPAFFSKTGVNASYSAKVAALDTRRHPVENVAWRDAIGFCLQLTEREDLLPAYDVEKDSKVLPAGNGYRLPTEAEWEFACRAGTDRSFWSGDGEGAMQRAGWFLSNADGQTHRVGGYKANPFGLYDMHGNVFEWVNDYWDASSYAQFEHRDAIDPTGPAKAGFQRVFRGGNWSMAAPFCRSAYRHADAPSRQDAVLGFRVTISVDAVRQLRSKTDLRN